MPRYDYRCRKCGEIFEVEHPMSGPTNSPVVCPTCDSADTGKVYLTAPAVKIWYKDASTCHHSDEKRPRFYPSVRNRQEVLGDA